ncbi:AbrB family transcriptional regulator [Halomonas sp. M5N1S17]|uniref:AbrB family transcriptional regulator n=1 Tax=Halomonas alkalisoli TaxID=2907158 RepID=UPI001F309936|nr:AbrB family transcriptional regulator [Halomonas alkalisoli]MCE9665990.1 AbrB family transcriptional regulator [Halomonas alkalisoli]
MGNLQRGWLRTLGIGGIGGALFMVLGLPVPWLLGALFAGIVAMFLGVCWESPWHGRALGQVLVGSTLGFAFTQDVLAQVVAMAGPILLGASLSILSGLVTAVVLRRTLVGDWATAYFASMPAGLAEMSLLGARHGGNPVIIITCHVLRVVSIVCLVPLGFVLLYGGDWQDMTIVRPNGVSHPGWLPITVAGAVLVALLFQRLRIPNALILGSICFGASVQLMDIPLPAIPEALFAFGQVLLGATLAMEFTRERMSALQTYALPAVSVTALLMSMSLTIALYLSWLFDLDGITSVIAMSPAGSVEMAVTAVSLGAEFQLVIAFHLARVFMINGLMGPIFSVVHYWIARRD